MNQRASGILLHPTSPSNLYPIGDLVPAAIAFANFMVKSGQRWWQMFPIGPGGEENSPYHSPSAFGGNPLLVSPDRLVEQGLLDRQDIELPISGGEGKVNYPAAARLKLRWLKKHSNTSKKTSTVAGNLSSMHLHARSLSGLRIFRCSRQSRGKRALRIGPDGTKSCERASQTPSFARGNTLPMTYVTISLSSGSFQCNGKS
jgi:4-alpha-glucanotransferase